MSPTRVQVGTYRCCKHCRRDDGKCMYRDENDSHDDPCRNTTVKGQKCKRGRKLRWR